MKSPIIIKNSKESLFYEERMAKKTTVRLGGRERKQKMKTDEEEEKEKKRGMVKWIGKSLKETKKIG